MEVKKYMTRIQVKPVTHKHRKKYFSIKIPCSYNLEIIWVNSQYHNMLNKIVDKKLFYIDKTFVQKESKIYIKYIQQTHNLYTKTPCSINEFKKQREHQHTYECRIDHSFLGLYFTEKTFLYILFKTKSEYLKFKMKYMQ